MSKDKSPVVKDFYRPSSLLSVGVDAKTIKGEKFGYLTGILYLSPSDLSGVNLCPMAELAQCVFGCLNMAGRGQFNSVQAARLNKTRYFLQDQEAFMQDLARDIDKLRRKAAKLNLIPVVRLNGTSDIRWENIEQQFTYKGYKTQHLNIFQLFKEVQFMDYTKIFNRKEIPSNYDLTFSFSGADTFRKYNKQAIKAGLRVAVVFRTAAEIPEYFEGMQVVNGDESDLRFLDPAGSVVALYAKGRARKDQSGFVVDALKYSTIKLEVAA